MKDEVCVKKAKEMKKKCTDMEANMCEESKSCEMKGEECVKKAKEKKKKCTDMEANLCEESKSCEMKDGLCVKKAKKEKKKKKCTDLDTDECQEKSKSCKIEDDKCVGLSCEEISTPKLCEKKKCKFEFQVKGSCVVKTGQEKDGEVEDVLCDGLEKSSCKKAKKCSYDGVGKACADTVCESFTNKKKCKKNKCEYVKPSEGSCKAKEKLNCTSLTMEKCKKKKRQCTYDEDSATCITPNPTSPKDFKGDFTLPKSQDPKEKFTCEKIQSLIWNSNGGEKGCKHCYQFKAVKYCVKTCKKYCDEKKWS